jgi:catechol 2,3-dioxygenase-like lactoylglutathione lyase family enzyme
MSLRDSEAVATIAVKDLDTAAKFYRDILGLEPVGPDQSGTRSFRSGKSTVLVYQSQFARTNKATAATWVVDHIEDVARELKSKGAKFERYDFPGVKHEGDIHVTGAHKVFWITDPDGNILSVVNRMPVQP